MKNFSNIFQIITALAIGILFYLHFAKKQNPGGTPEKIEAPAKFAQGVRIAHVNADTLDAKYTWLKNQKTAIEKRIRDAGEAMASKESALEKELAAFQEKYQSGTVPPAQLEQEYAQLMQKQQKLAEDAQRLDKKLADDQRNAYNELMTKVEAQLKTIQSKIGYDYILSYQRGGGQVLLTNDSLDITEQVLLLLNDKEK